MDILGRHGCHDGRAGPHEFMHENARFPRSGTEEEAKIFTPDLELEQSGKRPVMGWE